jgi:hypothetical protein
MLMLMRSSGVKLVSYLVTRYMRLQSDKPILVFLTQVAADKLIRDSFVIQWDILLAQLTGDHMQWSQLFQIRRPVCSVQ